MGFNWKNIIWTDEFTGLNHPTGQPIYIHRQIEIAQSSEDNNETSSPSPEQIDDKMIRTPLNKTTYIGEKFDTKVNTYLVADYKTGEILAGKNIDDQRPMASFTKVMTAYELMREGVNLSRSSTYNPTDHKSVYATFRIAAGEKILNKNLMYSGLVSSLNTPMKMLVDSVEEKENEFIKKMNTKAQDWSLNKTSFVDVTGEDLGNKTTARDYLSLYTKVTKNVDISEFLSTKSYQYNEMVDKDGNARHFDDNSNLLFKKNNLNFNIINSKTGYLDEAGAGLTMIIENKTNNKKFVIITMGNPDYTNRFDEPQRLAEWTINNF
jgi:D-alanyl-D-alanine carboxypeptidase